MGKPLFHTVAILGVGLIGGSLGLEIKKKRLAEKVIGHGRTRKNLAVALKRRLIDEITQNLAEAVRDADLILLATPILALQSHLKEIAQHAKPGAMVMDAGSTKRDVVRLAERVLPASIRFIGAHPMAGTEQTGAQAAIPNLFRGKKCILTPLARTSKKALNQARQFWKAMGAQVFLYSPKDHDTVLALVSHLPQMAAYALVTSAGLVLKDAEIRRVAGSGFRDTTRIAASPSEMWRDICLTNRDSLGGALKLYRKQIDRLIAGIEKGDRAGLGRYFERAARLRKRLA